MRSIIKSMPYPIKFWFVKLFSKPVILTTTYILYMTQRHMIVKDLFLDFLTDDYLTKCCYDLTPHDLTLIEIARNIDVEIIVENNKLCWSFFGLWWRVFRSMCNDESCAKIVDDVNQS